MISPGVMQEAVVRIVVGLVIATVVAAHHRAAMAQAAASVREVKVARAVKAMIAVAHHAVLVIATAVAHRSASG